MSCHAMHPIQNLFLEGFSYVLQIDMHFICTPMLTKFYSCKKWVLQLARPTSSLVGLAPLQQSHHRPTWISLRQNTLMRRLDPRSHATRISVKDGEE
jgi:hypothetical protein